MSSSKELATGVAWDNWDRFVNTLTGKDTLHDTVGVCYQVVDDSKSPNKAPAQNQVGDDARSSNAAPVENQVVDRARYSNGAPAHNQVLDIVRSSNRAP